MRTLRAGENLWRRLDERFGQAGRISDDVQSFGADHAQKVPPDLSAGPIVPQDGEEGKPIGRMRKRSRWVEQGGRRRSQRGDHWPEDRADPSGLAAGRAFLTLRAQLAGATIPDASGIQDPKGAIALWSAFLRVQRVMGGAE